MKQIYLNWGDLPLTKDGFVKLSKLNKAQKESYTQAVENYLDISKGFNGKKYLFQLTVTERKLIEDDIFLDEDGEFYSSSVRQYLDYVNCNCY